MTYNTIINPITNSKVLINSKLGKKILINYINLIKTGGDWKCPKGHTTIGKYPKCYKRNCSHVHPKAWKCTKSKHLNWHTRTGCGTCKGKKPIKVKAKEVPKAKDSGAAAALVASSTDTPVKKKLILLKNLTKV